MNLLKQTALILGLASLSLVGWSLFRDWRNKVSILFSFLCFVVSVWALSFVAHATLVGRLSYDIHLFCNVLLSPIAIFLITSTLTPKEDRISQLFFWVSLLGAIVLCGMILFSLGSGPIFLEIVEFWPTLIFLEYCHVLIQDYFFNARMESETVSAGKKLILYFGLGLTLALCTFDHIPSLGYTLPALGNVLFTIYLVVASQIVNPQKLLGIEALVSRLFAVITLSLIITGFFALLYNYISETFPLFLLNSFLISFAVLALWSPLVTFFRFLARKTVLRNPDGNQALFDNFKVAMIATTDLDQLKSLTQSFFKDTMNAAEIQILTEARGMQVPDAVLRYLDDLSARNLPVILHREILQREREQVLTYERKRDLDLLLQFLSVYHCTVIFPAYAQKKLIGLILIRAETTEEDVMMGYGNYARIHELMGDLGASIARLAQIEELKEKDRLILMGEMAAGLAHEVRNPLGAIRGAAELMDESAGPWAKVIREEVGRLNRLVSQFLDFAQNPKELQEEVDLNEVLGRSLQNLRVSISKNVELELVESPIPIRVSLVPDYLQQILHNLIQNALKAVDGKSGARIVVRVFERGFSVEDNGVGMDTETLSKVFQPFFTSFKDGTGLGLSICERLVHFEKGRLSLASVVGEGTVVRVEYPHA